MLQWSGCARQGQTCISPGQGTGEEAAPALSHVSRLMVVACQGHVTGFLLVLLQCRMGYNENKTRSFISPIPQPFLQHAVLPSVWTALRLKHISSARNSATTLREALLGSAPTHLFWLVPEPLSWARGAEGKTQPCKEPPGSPFRPSNNTHAPTGFIKSNWGHLLPPLAGLGTGLISWRNPGVNICLLQALKGSSELGSQVIQERGCRLEKSN